MTFGSLPATTPLVEVIFVAEPAAANAALELFSTAV
jgi:hypothetical protein